MVRNRDIAILIVSAVAILLSLESSTDVNVNVSWFIEPSNKHGKFLDGVPPPVIADLNGDGRNEIILITDDYKLQMLTVPEKSVDFRNPRAVKPEVQSETNLLAGVRISQGRLPVGLGRGYLDPYTPENPRPQAVCVVSEDWRVGCYTASDDGQKLRLLWETVVETGVAASKLGMKYHLEEVSVLVTPQRAQDGDRGLVVVAGRRAWKHNALVNQIGLEAGDMPEKIDPGLLEADPHLKDTVAHYNVYALDGGTGEVRWSHVGLGDDGSTPVDDDEGEIGQTQLKKEQILNTHQFKVGELRVREWGEAGGWLNYRRSMVEALPHGYFGAQDARLSLAHFQRERPGRKHAHRNKRHPDPHPALHVGGLIRAVPLAARLPHDELEHLYHPNVVLAYSKNGLEAISLRTGRQVAQLALGTNTVYADLNADGVVDQILLTSTIKPTDSGGDALASLFNTNHTEVLAEAWKMLMPRSHDQGFLPPCHALVLSGLPAQDTLFTSQLCVTGPAGYDPYKESRRHKKSYQDLEADVAPPLVLQQGKEFGGKTQKKAVVFATSSGVLSSYASNGDLNWALKRAPTWEKNSNKGYLLPLPLDPIEGSDVSNAETDKILIVGESEFAIYSSSGSREGSGVLPQAPSTKPIIGDFNNDGINDIIFICEDALLGYSIHKALRTRFLLVLVFLILIALIVVIFSGQYGDTLVESSRKKTFPHRFPRATDHYD
mmetsp:Transcript_38520/g.49765  ORF Transcript_38520/g.49765 Transcript_38520/m.49765 type:complete len:718 (+) Transcript_38520:14-2167(+)